MKQEVAVRTKLLQFGISVKLHNTQGHLVIVRRVHISCGRFSATIISEASLYIIISHSRRRRLNFLFSFFKLMAPLLRRRTSAFGAIPKPRICGLIGDLKGSSLSENYRDTMIIF